MGLVVIVSLSVFLLDTCVKAFLKQNPLTDFPFIDHVVFITVVFNEGAAFGFFNSHTEFLTILSVVFIGFLASLVYQERKSSKIVRMAYGFILGGAFCNLFDRVVYGYVVDYIDVKVWPVFNLSDSAITLGVLYILYHSLAQRRHEKKVYGQSGK
ncbi:MAG: signal peptidase II [Candidatus Omnitrophica bacterium]|nr:signal peptidase II [Candidatus Omnitrophota bacterium]